MQVTNPYQHFFDTDGTPLDNGSIYVGLEGLDAESNPQAAYFDKALTIPAAQPVATLNGYPVRDGSPAVIYVDGSSHSITVRNSASELVYSATSVTDDVFSSIAGPGFAAEAGYDNSDSVLEASNIQDAIDELSTDYVPKTGAILTGHIEAVAGASGAQVPQAQETAMLGSTQLAYRNKVVNGNFDINQNAVSGTVTLTSGSYGHDQWKAGSSGCTYTFSKFQGITTVTIVSGSLIQPIDGANLKSGSYILSWTGTSQGKIGAGSYGASGQTSSVTGGSNVNIEFGTGTLSLVQFELGSKSTLFEHMSEAQHFMRCAEFYYKGTAFWTGYAFNGARAGAQNKFPTRMRDVPVIANQNATVANGFPSTAFAAYGLTRDGFTADLIATSTVIDGRWSQTYTADARLP